MKILVVGGTGVLGKSIVKMLSKKHNVIVASEKNADIKVNIEDALSIRSMYQKIGKLDAVVCAAGKVYFGSMLGIQEEQYQIGLKSKLLGQVNLVLEGRSYLNSGGSFTLTSGSANRDPYRNGSGPAMINGAIDGFVKAAALDLSPGHRINAVSPSILSESFSKYADFFPGFKPVSSEEVALAYCKSVEGAQTGQIYGVGDLFFSHH